MAKKSSGRSSEQKRAERRERDRERAHQATEALLTSEGWQRWLRARAVFHSYSLHTRCSWPTVRRTRHHSDAGGWLPCLAEARPVRAQGRVRALGDGADGDQAA